MTKYRKLNRTEIERLTAQECMADNWNQVHVAEGFSPAHIAHTRFSGEVYLGRFEQEIELPGGLRKHAGLRHVTLHNCTIGNNTLIENIPNYVANYQIGDYCYIQNVNLLLTEGESCFGNNTEVSVLNETGGREVPIYNRLSAQLAYIVAMYRHRPDLIGRLRQMIADYARSVKSTRGTIGNGVHIVNAGTIRNVCIGDACRIEGASRLDNGTINSCTEAPVYIGANVTAEDFIISSGACVSDGVVLSRCFIGQACHLTHLFSAHDSLFFSNCQGENGEACAIFAGPYTVTMHKSSLLIAGMFSFLNAGSGSNQSNHMYKLGPFSSPGGCRTRVENHERLLHAVARQDRCLAHHGAARHPPRHLGHALLLPHRARQPLLPRTGCQPQKRGHHTRCPEMAQTRPAHRPRQTRLHQLQPAESLHHSEDVAGYRHPARA